MAIRYKTKYEGVYYILGKQRNGKSDEKIYYIYFRKNGKQFEEKAGRQFEDNMTSAKASRFRAERISGKRLSRKEIREQKEADHLAEVNRPTFIRLWQEYKTSNPQLKGLVQDENRFNNYILPKFGHKIPEELSPFEVDSFRINLMKSKKPATVKNVLELLRRLVFFGEKKKLCKGPDFTIQMPKVDNLKTEDLTSEELNRLLNEIEKEPDIQIAHLMKLALFTGMRRGELFRLQWSDINFERGFILIRDPKGGKNQSIPLNTSASKILENHPKSESPYVFPGKNGGQRKDVKRKVNRIKERAGLPNDFRALHGLRHVYASMLASSGEVDMYTLQKLLTHKSPTMTQRYAHLRDDTLKKASNLMGKLVEDERNNFSVDIKKIG